MLVNRFALCYRQQYYGFIRRFMCLYEPYYELNFVRMASLNIPSVLSRQILVYVKIISVNKSVE